VDGMAGRQAGRQADGYDKISKSLAELS